MHRRIALASCAELLPLGDPDDQLFIAACHDLGIEVAVCDWAAPEVDWSSFDLTVIRSTWDYTAHRTDFLRWLAATPRLHNPAPVVAANTDKIYLRELAAAGIPIVATQFVEPGQAYALPTTGEFVIKPSVGAGSRGAARFDSADPATADRAAGQVRLLHDAGRTVLIQPYLHAVDTDGETGLIFIDGAFSHAIGKAALLPAGAQHSLTSAHLYVAETISSRLPSAEELAVATRVLEHYGSSLYARVDLLPTPAGPVLLEAELSEPSLFLSFEPAAAARLADAVQRRLN